MDFSTLALFVLAGGAAYVGGKFVVGQDSAREERRRRAIQLAAWATNNGLPQLGKLAEAYAVGDLSSVVTQLKALREIISTDADAKAAVDRFLDVQLDKILATPTGKADLLALIEKKRPTITEK